MLAASCAPTSEPSRLEPLPAALHGIAGAAQGTSYSVQWWSAADVAQETLAGAIESELERLDQLLSNYRNDSTIETFNASATTEPQRLPPELIELLRTAERVHRASERCFDPTVEPLVSLWGLDTDEPRVPDSAAIDAVRERVGFDKIELAEGVVRKLVPGVAIDMSSIGQGYTVGRLAAIASEHGVENYLVELGGEIAARGAKPSGEPWIVGVEDASVAEGGGAAIRRRLRLPTDRAIAVITSGSYRHFFEADGTRYSHILDPSTGRPVEHALAAVTVVGTDPTTAAAWATALMCLGPQRGAAVAEREQLAAILQARRADGAGIEEQVTSALTADAALALE